MASAEKQLEGRRIIITRAPEQAKEWVRALELLGAHVSVMPLVDFAPPEDWSELDEQLRQLDGFDAILFLSKNAVRYIFARLRELGVKCESGGSSKHLIAAVGPATARALEQEGMHADYVAKHHSGDSLARELRPSLSGRRVLLPRSDRGDHAVTQALRKSGAEVTEVVAYRTVAPAMDSTELDRLRRGEADALVFASPSAFHNLCDSIGGENVVSMSARTRFVAIGPTTAIAIRRAGARVEIEASEATATSLADSIAAFFQSSAPAVKRA